MPIDKELGVPNNEGMDHVKLIDALGGTFAVAALVGVKPPSVSEWRQRGRIPTDKLMRLATYADERGIATRWQLFPDDWHLIWPELKKRKDSPKPKAVEA